MKRQGYSSRQIYDAYFSKVHQGQGYEAFKVSLKRWGKKAYADDITLDRGTYEGFIPKNATVQVDSEGNVVQAWIKQTSDADNIERLLEHLADVPKVEYIEPVYSGESSRMLEIPLYDVHFGINDIDYYRNVLNGILQLIASRHWECIQIIIGQDLFHNNDFRGRTAKGTPIEQVDIVKAHEDAKTMYFSIIRKARQCADKVICHYSEGNHDETIGYFFFRMLEEVFTGQVEFDNVREPRKAILWHRIFIGYGHCDDGLVTPKDIRCQFTIEFPIMFATAETREVHLGHLHREIKEGDESGIVIRRLSTGNKTDAWHNKNGYVGNHKRFQLFEYSHTQLKAIHYISVGDADE